jgi:vacuolar protein sorting-associated protein 72
VYRGDYKWSRLVGAWVGRGDYAARGVPDWFLDPSKEVKSAEPASAPADEAVDMKVEEEDKADKDKAENDKAVEEKAAEEKAGEEPRLEPVDGMQSSEAAAPSAPQTVST